MVSEHLVLFQEYYTDFVLIYFNELIFKILLLSVIHLSFIPNWCKTPISMLALLN